MSHLPLSLINRLSQTEPTLCLQRLVAVFPKDLFFFQNICVPLMCEKHALLLYMFFGDRSVLQTYCIDKAESERISQAGVTVIWIDIKCSVTTQKNTGIPFVDQKKMIFIITNINILYIFLLNPKLWTCIYKIVNIGLTIGSDLLSETYALSSKCDVPCSANTIALW